MRFLIQINNTLGSDDAPLCPGPCAPAPVASGVLPQIAFLSIAEWSSFNKAGLSQPGHGACKSCAPGACARPWPGAGFVFFVFCAEVGAGRASARRAGAGGRLLAAARIQARHQRAPHCAIGAWAD